MSGYRILLSLIALCFSLNVGAAPQIITTIAPVHSLVSAVVEGVGETELLFSASRSPHGAGLKPSQVQALANAELVVRVDPLFELAVDRVISQRKKSDADRSVLTLSRIPGIQLYTGRDIDELHQRDSHKSDIDHHNHDSEGGLDPHLWLSTHNASIIVGAIARRLAMLDAGNADLYHRNAVITQNKIAAHQREMQEQLGSLNSKWLFFHDAYQYFEKEFQLVPLAVVTADPERGVSGKRLRELVSLVQQGKLNCIFIEPQLRPDLITRLAEQSSIKVLILDPLGSNLKPGPELWFDIMRSLTAQLSAC